MALNRLIFDYDQLLICGPVFPHEVVGFSGGNKYLFPGIAGGEIINFTHWLGALIGNYHVIGAGYTPVRAVIDRAATLVPRPVACLALVVTHDALVGPVLRVARSRRGSAASALSAQTHIVHVAKPFTRVLSVMPEMYDDLWTAAKGMYKLEPAVADGGEVVIYAPHITEVSYTHGRIIDEIGYHCRDYFLGQWERFRDYPGGVLAHSTHVKGLGTYDAATGVETPRIQVTLATGIPEERCRRINLGYCDPRSIRPDDWAGRERRRRPAGAAGGRDALSSGRLDMLCDIGVVGLGVMGSNLALNMERNGFRVPGYDLDAAKGQAFVSGPGAGKNVELATSPADLMARAAEAAPHPADGARRAPRSTRRSRTSKATSSRPTS